MDQHKVIAAIESNRDQTAAILDFEISSGKAMIFNFTAANTELSHLDINDVSGFTEYLFEQIADADPPVGIGRYNEDRVLYRHSPLFDGRAERRSIHLGIDLFVIEGTEIRTPITGRVYSLADNAGLGDYGPTVILEHRIADAKFFTLYGHLSRTTIEDLRIGSTLIAGQRVGEVGDLRENGGWPPHLHFQIVTEDPGDAGDYPGVASPSEREHYLAVCPDPNIILGIPGL